MTMDGTTESNKWLHFKIFEYCYSKTENGIKYFKHFYISTRKHWQTISQIVFITIIYKMSDFD